MAKFIKRNIDIAVAIGIGLSLLFLAMLGIHQKIPYVDYVSAATTVAVTVSATVAQSESLTVSLVNSGVAVNSATTTVTTTASTVPLGTLSTGANTIAAHTLTMSTNAGAGYTVTAVYNNRLRRTATTSDDIDDHSGTNASPSPFSGAGTEAFGYTTEDFLLSATGDGANRFSGGDWAGFSTTAYEVAYHTAPVNATTTKIGYQAGISATTPAGTDYACTVTFTMLSSF